MTTTSERARLLQTTETSFEADVLEAKTAVLVDFTAAWCGPCRALAPILASLAEERRDTLAVVKVDGDASPGLATRYGVRGFPTLILFKGGREVARQVGLSTKERLRAMLASAG